MAGSPVTMDPTAFGRGMTPPTFGAPYAYGGVSQLEGYYPGLGGVHGLGRAPVLAQGVGDIPAAPSTLSSPSPLVVMSAFGVMALGGALTGYLASIGTGRGALIGAGTHLALFSFGTALAGRSRLSTGWIVAFVLAGLATTGGVSYLFYRGLGRGR